MSGDGRRWLRWPTPSTQLEGMRGADRAGEPSRLRVLIVVGGSVGGGGLPDHVDEPGENAGRADPSDERPRVQAPPTHRRRERPSRSGGVAG